MCSPGEYQEINVYKIWTTYMWNIGKSINIMQKLRGAGIYCDSNWLDAKICIRLKKIMKFEKGKPRWNLENLYAVRQKTENFVEAILVESDVELEMWKCRGTISTN